MLSDARIFDTVKCPWQSFLNIFSQGLYFISCEILNPVGEQLIKESFYQLAGFTCKGCFDALLRTGTEYTSGYRTTQPDIMPPPDESTSLLREARPLNWRQKCCNFCHWFLCFGHFLLLLADVGLSILSDISTFIYELPNGKEVRDVQESGGLRYFVRAVIPNATDTLICWIFLGIVARSPRFVGYFKILKNLIRLPRFWSLVFFLVLYIIGAVIALWNFFSNSTMKEISFIRILVVMAVMELLNVFTKLALVGVLNHVQVQNVARSRFKYWLLKETLAVIWFCQFCTLIVALMSVYFSFLLPIARATSDGQQVRSSTKTVMELLLLPFVTRITELIWTAMFQDNKCIIGKYERNSFTRQNPRISNAIERNIWKKLLNSGRLRQESKVVWVQIKTKISELSCCKETLRMPMVIRGISKALKI